MQRQRQDLTTGHCRLGLEAAPDPRLPWRPPNQEEGCGAGGEAGRSGRAELGSSLRGGLGLLRARGGGRRKGCRISQTSDYLVAGAEEAVSGGWWALPG